MISVQIVEMKGEQRTDTGKTAARAVRKEGRVPCVLYGGDDNYLFSVDPHDFKDLVYTPDFRLAEIEIDGKKIRCILKDMQFHPLTDEILHADFMELIPGRKVKVNLPVRLKGTPVGVKSGGILQQATRKVRVKALVDKLVDELTINVSHLELHDAVRVRDIDTAEGIEILNSPGLPLASVIVPRMLRSAATAEAKEGLEEGEELPEGEEAPKGEEGAEETAEEATE